MSAESLQILFVENDRHDYRLVKRALQKGGRTGDLFWAKSGEEALQLLNTTIVDVILLDYRLFGLDGLATLVELRAQGIDTATIIITGQGSEKVAVEALKLGAEDYIVKDSAGEYLKLIPTIVRKAYANWQNLQARQEAEKRLAQNYRRQSALASIELSINQAHELKAVLERICQVTTDLLPATGGASVILWDSVHEVYFISASTVPDQPNQMGGKRVRRRGGATHWIIENQKPLIVSDIRDDPFGANPMLVEFGIQAYVGMPLVVGDRVQGVLYALEKQTNQFSPDDLDFLDSLSRRAALSVAKVKLFEDIQIANKQLSKQQEALQEYTVELETQNLELDAFTHTVAHDLKTPLALILGYSELLVAEPAWDSPGEELNEQLSIINRTSQRMSNIVDELLLLATIRKQDVHMNMLHMSDLLDEALLQVEYVRQQVQPDIILPEVWPPALGYGPWIVEVWANYLSNAMKYGGDSPRIALGATVLPDNRVKFWIRDNGPGIPPVDQVKLFALFTQLSQVYSQGHGLGLSIVKRIIEKCGGQVGVYSEPGQGSTFWFILPGPPPG